MAAKKNIDKKLAAAFSNQLLSRREILLNNWRQRCGQDELLTGKINFTIEECNDQIPILLDILTQRLHGKKPEYDPIIAASEHGLRRWQSGYELPELIVELEHLFAILHEEIDAFLQTQTDINPAALGKIYREIHRIYSESCRGSIIYYNKLRQTAATEQTTRLQKSLDRLQGLVKVRNEHLRHSSHDLRSSFSVLLMSSQLWQLNVTDLERTELIGMLNRNLTSIRDMFLQLTDFARVEAEQETLTIKKFDVAALIGETTELVRPSANAKKLDLKVKGPAPFMIQSDRVQIQRILLNLLYNAIKYTKKGEINITWMQENDSHWLLSVQGSGEEFSENAPAGLLAGQIKASIHSATTYQEMLDEPVPTITSNTEKTDMKESESLGLFIVKKICELMKAGMYVESKPGFGPLVRIRFQINQEQSKQVQ